ncbi:hypothetical protein DICA1_D06898 [Diutina catenulata]
MDQEDVYKQFLNYDFGADDDFVTGLQEIIDGHVESLREQDPSATVSAADRAQLTDQAKVFFFCSKTGNILELDEYRVWLARGGNRYKKSGQIEEIEEGEQTGGEQTAEGEQTQAAIGDGTNATSLDTTSQAPEGSTSQAPEGTAPYSSNYQNVVELILAGKEVPGIKEIPDTVLPEQQSEAQASQRKKPWEK